MILKRNTHTPFIQQLFRPLPTTHRLSPTAYFLLLTAYCLLLTACTLPGPTDLGTLAGHVTVGPLSPVAIAGYPEPTPGPEVYQGREIVIFAEDGRNEVARVPIGGDGNYRADLPVGSYTVDINHLGIDIAKELPQTVEIRTGQTTQLDINIDTGIR